MSTPIQITGKIREIGRETQVTEKFRKRDLIIETDDQYSQVLKIEFVKDNISKLDSFSAGRMVVVIVNIRGREHGGNYFTSLQGYSITNK